MPTATKPAPSGQSTGVPTGEVSIVRHGEKIIIPEDMPYSEVIVWIKRKEESEEKVVAIHAELKCFPLDGLIAVSKALEEIYGFTALENKGWFGQTPPLMVQVPLADGAYYGAPMGRIAAPTWEGGYLETTVTNEAVLYLGGSVKRKFEPQVQKVVSLARKILKEQSIYKGQAAALDLEWMVDGSDFNPTEDAPQFMQLNGIQESDLILNRVPKADLTASIWMLIERTEDCKVNKIPLKHGLLLSGNYGTGKSLCAKVTAAKAKHNNWTFLYLKNAHHIAKALRIAELYAPTILFCEDIDQVMVDKRDGEVNEILNTIDGVDTKDKPIITVLTTNHPEKINPAFLRAGRIDTIVNLGLPDSESAWKFVELYAKDDEGRLLLSSSVDRKAVGLAMKDLVPAFIAEAVQKAKRLAIHREGAAIVGCVTTEDLVDAAMSKKEHIKMAEPKGQPTEAEKVQEALRLVKKA